MNDLAANADRENLLTLHANTVSSLLDRIEKQAARIADLERQAAQRDAAISMLKADAAQVERRVYERMAGNSGILCGPHSGCHYAKRRLEEMGE